jgi:hypothetical protein
MLSQLKHCDIAIKIEFIELVNGIVAVAETLVKIAIILNDLVDDLKECSEYERSTTSDALLVHLLKSDKDFL